MLITEMEVQIISRESVKPSSSTLPNLRKHKLSFLSQLAINVYCPIILFYSDPFHHGHTTIANLLKYSLSHTLNYFSVWVGRFEDTFTINCNDEGAEFIEARISTTSMSETIRNPQSHLLQELLPFRHYNIKQNELVSKPLVAVQLNYFKCGGMALGVCISHAIADGLATATFLKTWAQVARGITSTIDVPTFDSTALFPPQDISALTNQSMRTIEAGFSNMQLERFHFDSSKIARLRENIVSKGKYLNNPTRYEAVTALLWSAFIDATEKRNEKISMHILNQGIEFRKRMNPALPQNCIGTIVSSVSTIWPAKKGIHDYNSLAQGIRDSIRKVDQEFLQSYSANFVREASEMMGNNDVQKVSLFGCSSWSRFPFHEVDFGWGKPVWLGYVPIMNNMALLLDSIDGEAIEAWVTLSKQDMDLFKQNPDILASTTLSCRI